MAILPARMSFVDCKLCSVSSQSTLSGSSLTRSSASTCRSAQQAISIETKKVLPLLAGPVMVVTSHLGKQGLS